MHYGWKDFIASASMTDLSSVKLLYKFSYKITHSKFDVLTISLMTKSGIFWNFILCNRPNNGYIPYNVYYMLQWIGSGISWVSFQYLRTLIPDCSLFECMYLSYMYTRRVQTILYVRWLGEKQFLNFSFDVGIIPNWQFSPNGIIYSDSMENSAGINLQLEPIRIYDNVVQHDSRVGFFPSHGLQPTSWISDRKFLIVATFHLPFPSSPHLKRRRNNVRYSFAF